MGVNLILAVTQFCQLCGTDANWLNLLVVETQAVNFTVLSIEENNNKAFL